ncbi:bifunctional DNA-binding transcriptional regulator/O6-methylguanine-DNA methyltransferase Ada [Oscillatoria sp. FACHB-1407]|uniref:bifunctional DNA-binding transcriptional regulator/O6-methylguanine-DNA methyltransferase Ada n=1 Tax=Oscillatoria sp. FACHB-1407 TaxID=2692847 RepID=UPI001684F44D|nr:bifunctional DNA-binding transcriptional regulator/O6-methylguanine-DNA methyltransferase Ada [Oscillatoria sp. FACHB-1407]MBD2461153.1 bifunctional DNA-binding transcriptional regulator/O6-methylguanine-DNA methyltransferase Ada [Oscillatoria sp. FACHB-1407]
MMTLSTVGKLNSFATESDRWEAIAQRSPNTDGTFFYAVKTTGVYCRPTCSSRRPKRENVLFFESCDAAETAGFRPCKRCSPRSASPQQQQVERIAEVCKQIEVSETLPSLDEMAQMVGLSPYHFHRVFKEIVGITPKQYAIAQRTKRVRQQLQENTTVTQAIYDAGFETSSTFYERSTDLLGMTPSDYQQGASGIDIRYTVQPCWLGWVLVAATPKGICAIAFGDTPETLTTQLQADFPKAQFSEGNAEFQTWVEQVIQLIETPQQTVDLPLDIQGTAFQQQVWQALQTIPPGTTVSYAEVAQRIGKPKSVRAVANACGSNHIAVAIPCHRVVGSDGSLRGYRWGSDRKQALLDKESTLNQPSLF